MLDLDRIASLAVLAFGGVLMVGALRMDLGSPNQPGPGFLPLGAAGLLVALSLALAISSFRRRALSNATAPSAKGGSTKPIIVVASLATYCALLPLAGYILAPLALMSALFLVAEPGRWLAALAKAALSTAVTWLLFEKLLMIQFPAGPFGN